MVYVGPAGSTEEAFKRKKMVWSQLLLVLLFHFLTCFQNIKILATFSLPHSWQKMWATCLQLIFFPNTCKNTFILALDIQNKYEITLLLL